MKTIIRTFVAVLALTGAVASAHTSSIASHQIVTAQMSAFPVPMCPPDDPNACGMGAPNPK